MNIDRATAAQSLLKRRKPQSGPPVRSSEMARRGGPRCENCGAPTTVEIHCASQWWKICDTCRVNVIAPTRRIASPSTLGQPGGADVTK